MKNTNLILIDSPLAPDPLADEEMSGEVEAIADEDLKGSRLLLVLRTVDALDQDGMPGGVVKFACSFQPAPGTRFVSAQLRLLLSSPTDLKITDLAPRVINDQNPVEFTLNRKGALGIKDLPVALDPSVELEWGKKYSRYYCQVHGTGDGTNLARWVFQENPQIKDGLGREQDLALTFPVTGKVSGKAMVSAKLVRKGIAGKLDSIRELILREKPEERSYPFGFEIPKAPSKDGLRGFFRFD